MGEIDTTKINPEPDAPLKDLEIGDFTLKGSKFFKHPVTGWKHYDVTTQDMGHLFAALSVQRVPYSGKDVDEIEFDGKPHIYSEINAGDYGVIRLHVVVDHEIG